MPARTPLTCLACLLAACAAPPGTAESEVPCGIVDCAVGEDMLIPDYTPPPDFGKADREGVEDTLRQNTMDGVLDAADVLDLFDAAGQRVGRAEMRVIRDALESTDFEVTDDAVRTALDMALVANLFEHERTALTDDDVLTYGGSDLPEAVQEFVARARLNGAIAYDVQEVDEDDGELVWNPYPSTTPPVENMTFEYTEVTPAALLADLNDTTTIYNRIAGTETAEYCDAAGDCQDYQRARYVEQVGGTGGIAANYDEVYHPDIYARGTQGQRWANNCAILSDGSIHCLPAARRSVIQDLILTNPHLSRCNSYAGYEEGCRHLLYHGHIDVRDGVVTGVEMSGRISKRAARGRATFIDPIGLLEAWGFELSPSLRLRFGNTTAGTPLRDVERHTVTETP
ncbi:MAG TPA: hypothetical protein ENK57_03660 [Polyangiaceae bacterium]|nr:hypothetical protein [Polyangiaceae bacterium]